VVFWCAIRGLIILVRGPEQVTVKIMMHYIISLTIILVTVISVARNYDLSLSQKTIRSENKV